MSTEDVQQVETETETETEIVDAGTRLLDAIQARDTPQALALLKQGAPIWFQEQETGWSALHFAAYYEDVELVEMLIERGAIWNASQFISSLHLYTSYDSHYPPDPVPNVADYLGNTPADIALSLNNEAIYQRVRDAGLRSGPH